VHLGAPGDQIYSAFPATDSFYFTQSGSSFAAPYVSGACALLAARFPAESHQTLISRILNGTDPLPSLAGKCTTGGRLNLRKALSPPISLSVLAATNNNLSLRVSAGPNRIFTIQTSPDFQNWLALSTNTTSGSGLYDFTDSTGASNRFYRAISAP
jgi:subtilisin family serine protease